MIAIVGGIFTCFLTEKDIVIFDIERKMINV